MRCPLTVASQRCILCIFPAYAPSFGTFSHAYRLLGRVRAFMPPQGLLLIAAYLPESWPVRFVDENIAYVQRSIRAGVPVELHNLPGRLSWL